MPDRPGRQRTRPDARKKAVRPTPRWLWPHAVGLDAALLAPLWLLAFSEWLGIPPHAGEAVALGCGVWSLYLLDRVWDVTRRPSRDETDDCQHGLARRFPLRLAAFSVLLALAGGGVAAFSLSMRQIDVFLILMVAVSSYYVVLARRSGARRHSSFLRSVVVGMLFVTGCYLLPWLRDPTHGRAVLAWLGTGAVFAANALLCDVADEGDELLRQARPQIFALAGLGVFIASFTLFWPAMVAGLAMPLVSLARVSWRSAWADAILVATPLGFLAVFLGK